MESAVVYSALLLLVCYVSADSPYYEALAAHAEVKKYEPMVAFLCGRPAMYRSESGWARDTTTDCLNEAVDILDYCKKKYPDDEIRNIVEASEMYSITNWCPASHKECKHGAEQTVRPYRCLVGEFQSDALLVPPHCNFSHEHNAKKCMDFFEWSAAATSKCQDQQLRLQSFAMLQPCGLKVFTGVEFVCCPHANEQGSTVAAKKVIKLSEKKSEKEKKVVHHVVDKPKQPKKSQMNAYEKYLRFSEEGEKNEHQRFRGAIKVWQEEHHEKIRNMMKDWSAARKHVTDLRATDPKSAAALNKDLTERFQKMYQALEQDGGAKKSQLVAIHQQRIQARLNLKKRTAMENYLRTLENEEPTDILKALEHYIRAEEKDRIHTVNHYEHVREIDSDDADRIIPQTKEHLKVIEQRINQSLEMLQRVPQYKDKIQVQIREFMKNYHSVDETVKHVILSPPNKKQVDDNKKPEEEKPIAYNDDLKTDVQLPQKIDDGGLYEKNIIEVAPLQPNDEKKPVEEDKPKTVTPVKDVPKKGYKAEELYPQKKGRFDIETTENEHKYVDVEKPKPKASHHTDTKMSVEKSHIMTDAGASTSGSVFAIAIGSVAVFVIIIVTIVVMRKKAQRTPTTTGFVEIEQPSSPEEKHVANMQMNGYENPTYKYFETGTPKTC